MLYLKGYWDTIRPEGVLDVCGKQTQKGAQMEQRKRNHQINKQQHTTTQIWHYVESILQLMCVIFQGWSVSTRGFQLYVNFRGQAQWVVSECNAS